MKNSFLDLFSIKIMCIYIQCKSSQSSLHIFNYFSKYSIKTHENALNLFEKTTYVHHQFSKTLFLIKNLSNVFFKFSEHFLK